MKQILLSIAVFTMFLPGVSMGQVLPFSHYTPDNDLNPLPSAEVLQTYQDRQGFIWFAIYSSGLVRYDGLNMKIYGLENGLPDLTVWDMIEDPSGRLWVSSNAGIAVTEHPLDNYGVGESLQFATKINGTELANVAVNHNRMIADNEGRIWVGTESMGLIRYRFTDTGSLESDTLSTAIDDMDSDLAVRSIVARNDSSVWVALLGGELLEFDNSTLQQVYRTGTERNINTLFETPDGTLWGGEQNGSVWKLIEEAGKKEFIYLKTTSTSNIPDITLSSDNTLWISSEGSGLINIDPVTGEQITAYTRKNGLLGEIIYNVFEDREKNIWIAQSGGVSKLRYNYRAFRNLTANSQSGEKPVLPSPSVNTVLPSSNQSNPCALWAGTSEGGVACIDSSFDSEYIQRQDGLTANWVNGLVYDSSGRVWAGTSRGLNSISFLDTPLLSDASESNEISIFGKKAFLSTYPAASVLAVEKLMIHENSESGFSKESIWFPAYQSVYVFVNDKLFTLNSSTGLPSAIFNTAAFDDNKYLWIGTRDRGIYKSIEPFTLESLIRNEENEQPEILFEPWWSIETGAPSNQIEKMTWYSGSMWVGTPAGLLAIESESKVIKHFITTSDGLRANNATSFAISPVTGKLWVGTNQGLAEIDPDSGSVLKTVTRLDGLVDNEVWFYGSVQFDSSGTLYYGTAKGITLYNQEEDKINEVPPKLILTDFISEDISSERNEFIFEYAALSFGNERQVRYQTRLIGFNDEWSPLKTETRINYTNLSAIFLPKTYQFEVRAFNDSNVSSDETLTYAFSVNPPPFLSWWAFFLYAIALSLVLFTVDRFQRARLIKKERETAHLRETELKAETAIARSNEAEAQAKALQAENDLKAAELEKARELEEAYHELKATQSRLIQAEKMASLGRLSTGIAHEIKNPLNFINNFAEVSRELVGELEEAIRTNDLKEVEFILNSLGFNTQKIEEHGKRADAIVRSMMQHSRGTIGELEPVQINNLIAEYTELAYHGKKVQFDNLNVTIHSDLDPTISEISVMPQKLGQVFQNIIENAIDSVWEFAKNKTGDYEPIIEIKTVQVDKRVEIHISDNGPGIPDQIKEKIFEPFFTTKPTGEGTGLGLSLSYDIVTQMHNGKLEIGTSKLGGASFVISLPVNVLADNKI